ncbi:MAG: Nramp family divalent metal transporter [Planctomycetota bacterium]
MSGENGPAGAGGRRGPGLLALIGPGVLVAATGVGAGDLATAGFAGSKLGLAVAWAVVVGAAVKLVLNENLARFQLATGQTILTGALKRLGAWIAIPFGVYLLAWSWFVGLALISACGVTAHALVPVFDDASTGRAVWGGGLSLVAVAMVLAGGFRWFERIMATCIAVMFAVVLATAIVSRPDLGELARGLTMPLVPDSEGAFGWTLALLGGVGGTLTVICYGYWMRQAGRDGSGAEGLRACRLDLTVGYSMTALFGIGMLVIASGIEVDGRGAGLITTLAGELGDRIGVWARWVFLIGAFGAVFSSLLGVWQSVPFVYCELLGRLKHSGTDALRSVERSGLYRVVLALLATVPMTGLFVSFKTAQQWYGIAGALFIPMLGLALLLLNVRKELGPMRNRAVGTGLLVLVLTMCAGLAFFEIRRRLAS